MLTFADELKQSSIATWQQILNHNFITEIYNGILPLAKFIFYLKQDRIFLEEFCRFLSVAKQKSSNSDANLVNKFFDDLLYSTVNFEMKMQDQLISDSLDMLLSSLSSSLDIKDLHYMIPNKITLEYTFYLRQVSSNGSIYEIVSSMAPCPWTYFEIAEKFLLSKSHYIQTNKIFKKWMHFYSSEESRIQVEELKNILCILAGKKAKSHDKDKEDKLATMKKHFATACKYEFLFWDMGYHNHI